MSLEKMGQKSIESNEAKVRLQATPEDVENVWKSQKRARDITYANDVLKVLDYPDNVEEEFRKILLQENPEIVKELAKKSKQEILLFLTQWKNKEKESENQKNNQKETKLNQDIQKIDSKANEQEIKLDQKATKLNQDIQKNDSKANEQEFKLDQKATKLNQDIQKIKSVFTPQILEKNETLSNLFQKLDNEKDKQKTLETFLHS